MKALHVRWKTPLGGTPDRPLAVAAGWRLPDGWRKTPTLTVPTTGGDVVIATATVAELKAV